MGFSLELYALVGVAVATFYFLLPSPLAPVVWRDPSPLLKFEGPLTANAGLANAVLVAGNFSGPESTAFDADTGYAYVSLSDGTVGTFSANGTFLGHAFFTGGYLAYQQNGLVDRSILLRKWCNTEAMEGRLAWSVAAERKCGRPLGLRVRQEGRTKYLYIMDAYHGLFKLNLADSSVQHLVTPESAIKTPKGSDAAASKPAKFFNDLDVTADGRVLFTDSSYKHTRSENRQEVLDGAPRGRLLQFDPAPGQGLKTLVCGLHFPNGVQLLSQREVLVVELGRFRVLKVHLERVGEGALASCGERGTLAQALGEEADTRYGHWGIDYFSKNIPGLGDNVRLDAGAGAGGNHYLVGCGSKSAQPFSLLWLAYQHGWLRDALGKLLPMQLVEKLVPKYGLVLVLDQAGKTVASLHDATGRVALLSQAQRHPVTGDLWLGSHSESLAILHAEHVPRTWA